MNNKNRWLVGLLTVVLLTGLMTPYIPRSDAADYTDNTLEFTQQFVTECLARLGRGYYTGGGHSYSLDTGQYFDCSGLIADSLEALGMPCPGLSIKSTWDWDVWGKTIDWHDWFSSRTNGEILSYTLTDGTIIQYQVFKSSSTSFENMLDEELLRTYFSTPGTILLKMKKGQTSGHMAVSLGTYEWQGDADATEQAVRTSLIAQYADRVVSTSFSSNKYCISNNLETLLAEGGANNVYEHEAVWECRTRTDISEELGDFYNPVWQIDSLNNTTGVSINNNPYGKDYSGSVYGILVPVIGIPYGNVGVQKVDSYGNPIAGISFALYARVGEEYVELARNTTDSEGTILFDGATLYLRNSETYYVRELAGQRGYASDLRTYYPVTIVANTTQWAGDDDLILNPNWTGTLEIIKTDSDTGEPLSDAVFTVSQYNASTNSYENYLTVPFISEDAVYRLTGLPWTMRNQGRYIVTESEAPYGYENSGWEQAFVLSENDQVFSYQVENTPTRVEFSKTSLVDGSELVGAVLQILDTEGTVVYEWVTNGTKTTLTGILNPGETYTLVEIIAPDGHVRTDSVTFTVAPDGSITRVAMTDDYTKVRIKKISLSQKENET